MLVATDGGEKSVAEAAWDATHAVFRVNPNNLSMQDALRVSTLMVGLRCGVQAASPENDASRRVLWSRFLDARLMLQELRQVLRPSIVRAVADLDREQPSTVEEAKRVLDLLNMTRRA